MKIEKERLTELSPVKRITVSLPASIAYDLGRFQEVQQNILERLGCPACTSGHDIRFDIERNFVVDANGNINVPNKYIVG